MADLLTAVGVRKEFGGLVAVNDVDFTIPERTIVSLIGPNGAGKTTFFNMLTGVYKPTAGQITFDGHDVTGRTPDELGARITKRIFGWAATHGPVEIKYDQGNWMARDPKGAWLSTLLNIFGDTTGLEAKPVATAGSTTAKLMPNAINFGPAMPGKKYTAHNANEFKEAADLDLDMQMFTEMLVRIGNLSPMQ